MHIENNEGSHAHWATPARHKPPNNENFNDKSHSTDKSNIPSHSLAMLANSNCNNAKPKKANDSLPGITPIPALQNDGHLPAVQGTINRDTASQLTGKLYYPNFMDDSLKPGAGSAIELAPELESLQKLIMPQPEAFTPHLKELRHTNLTHSKVINMKKDSLVSLTLHKKIPRSLRIKCKPSTTPDYASNQNFLWLKEELQSTVHEFITYRTKIMIEWAEYNIHLLLNDRCHSILSKALPLLEGLSSYYAEVIHTPTWASTSSKLNTLLLFKLYLSNDFLDVNKLIDYLQVLIDTVRLIGTKILTNNARIESATRALNSAHLSKINFQNREEFLYISKTLINFDQIMHVTTIDLWRSHTKKVKQASPAINLK
jgi:hypothetical protein